MNRKTLGLVVLVALTLWTVLLVRAQSSGGYDRTWNTVDGGGGVNRSGAYILGGAIGQPDAGLLNGGNYTLSGGFWQSGVSAEPPAHHIFLPLVLR